MIRRSTAPPLFAFALVLSVVTAALIYANRFVFPETALAPGPSLRWLALFPLALTAQLLLGFSLWWLLRRRQRSMVQTEVLHSIVHEFQTPITAIQMAADILDSPIARNHPERTDKYVRIIREETERLQQQVETMLTLARADRNTLTLNLEPIQIHYLLHSVAERHGDYLNLNLQGKDTYVLADRLHLTNVLYNLIDNAVKYSADKPEITLVTKANADGMTISVRDRGVGISPKQVSHIFQPFFRVDDCNQTSVKGFGLGLSYVQRIVQAHNWTIWVKSELGQGSEFSIQIPTSSLLPVLPNSIRVKEVS
ncbi:MULTISPECIES: sensor histidine kinase [Spirosoma]|uniref:histidine kinase n=1 Tax=Spirosoma liriopis TaxID=2937440 RepID=A0ABT0HMG1_9BACT|nr:MULTISPECIES: HAMP domain-containing sensor histidine kinase [Spirosoma]MCK8493369.1 HAMP domain-containing histidine kinase [Spirosoma liriopis]UHG92756.1 HAMP domain-containing histidine kinase [Spirosoma oryzicola]